MTEYKFIFANGSSGYYKTVFKDTELMYFLQTGQCIKLTKDAPDKDEYGNWYKIPVIINMAHVISIEDAY